MSSDVLTKASEQLASSKSALSRRIRGLDFVPSVYLPTQAVQQQQPSGNKRQRDGSGASGSLVAAKKPAGAVASRAPPAATTAISTLSGKLFQIIDHLKRTDAALTALEIKTQLRVDILADRQLYDLVVNNAKIAFGDGKYAYKPLYNVRSKQDLVDLVREHWSSGKGGLHVRDLKDSWKTISKDIEELVADKTVIVLRQKDGKPAVVFYNPMPAVETKPFEPFRELWKQFAIPDDADLQRELSSAGLSLLQVEEDKSKATDGDMKGRKKRRTRQIKITNTHLKDIDLSVDYPTKKRAV